MHTASPRRKHAFITFKLCRLTRNLGESCCLGIAKVRNCQADNQHIGLISAADGGALFSMKWANYRFTAAKRKLLRFLESGEILPLGETQPKCLNVRVCSTATCCRDGANGGIPSGLVLPPILSVELPPLRERKEDDDLLGKRFLEQFAAQLKTCQHLQRGI